MIRMTLSALLLLPLTGLYAKLIERLTPSNQEATRGSYLDETLILRPEKAISASIQELQRIAAICEESLLLHADLFRSVDRKTIQKIIRNEEVINEIKIAMDSYTQDLMAHYLSKRQAVMLQHINRCMSNLERIGDHVDRLREITVKRLTGEIVLIEKDLLAEWFKLYGSALKVIRLTIESLDGNEKKFQKMAKAILDARDAYVDRSLVFRSRYNDKLAGKDGDMSPEAGMYLTKYVDTLDRIVRHSKSIALLEQRPEFSIKRKKLERYADKAPEYVQPEMVDLTDYLEQLMSEDYF
jgi:phosphate:Na+ symporter